MRAEFTDYNGAEGVVASVWPDFAEAIAAIPLHAKHSDQADMQGDLTFDPVGSNRALQEQLIARGWASSVAIPSECSALGTSVDFEKQGILAEVQFANYPFFLNNVIRALTFVRMGIPLNGHAPRGLVLITKSKTFPAAQSTLHYEQARDQLSVLVRLGIVDLPVRLVGLCADLGSTVPCVVTTYEAARHSRTIAHEVSADCCVAPNGARALLRLGEALGYRGQMDMVF